MPRTAKANSHSRFAQTESARARQALTSCSLSICEGVGRQEVTEGDLMSGLLKDLAHDCLLY